MHDDEVVDADVVEAHDDVVVVRNTAVSRAADARTSELERMRDKLSRFLPRAVEILTELAEGAENERVRLAAAESVLDRAGLGKSQTTQLQVSSAEHEIANREAEEMVARMQKNVTARGLPTPTPSIDALLVLEGDDDTLPTTTPTPDAVETTATTTE